ncbi:hypothetical protein [Pseudonocardia sp. GCM10023141]|uniref:hypothetical protein n=1 Tax=Pseudonocardia sp. GCM10023141 TaxID=3252653 RepID=UPI003606F87D
MDTALLVLLGVAFAVWLSAARPQLFPQTPPADRERERQLAELRAHRTYSADITLPPH